MNSSITLFVKTLWEKIRTEKRLTVFEQLIFLVLFCFSYLYRFIFCIALWLKKLTSEKLILPGTTVISVGNISVGGTGKTVVTEFLVTLFKSHTCVIVLRGYKGTHEKTGKSLVVSDGKKLFCSAVVSGDEAFMLATTLAIPVIVGSNRAQSCLLVEKFFHPDFIILDDAYQNFHVTKNIQILLLDARKPFENGYVLPAGPLREKDISRSDCIILTHADEVSSVELEVLKRETLAYYDQKKIFTGKHCYDGLYLNNDGLDKSSLLYQKPVIVIAGIGSISGFLKTITDIGMIIATVIELEDHHEYAAHDLETIEKATLRYSCQTVVTTAKDWVKLKPLMCNKKICSIYVVRIKFEFLSSNEYSSFREFLKIM